MRDLGNTLVVVEHDCETMLASDYLIDIDLAQTWWLWLLPVHQKKLWQPHSITGRYLKELKVETFAPPANR